DSFSPSHKLPLLTTQSIQLSCYLAAAFFSTAWLITMAIMRFRNRLVPEDRFLTAPPIERPTCPKPLVTHRSPHHQRDSRR
ncbi:MAG: hypothetical protein O3A87_04505, partial [Verrucomicrobia bacterium]|nr:hypothetical protein [Verrucomicrobiota bacterium]